MSTITVSFPVEKEFYDEFKKITRNKGMTVRGCFTLYMRETIQQYNKNEKLPKADFKAVYDNLHHLNPKLNNKDIGTFINLLIKFKERNETFINFSKLELAELFNSKKDPDGALAVFNDKLGSINIPVLSSRGTAGWHNPFQYTTMNEARLLYGIKMSSKFKKIKYETNEKGQTIVYINQSDVMPAGEEK